MDFCGRSDEKWSDRQRIFKKADQYKIPHASVSIALDNKQEETRPEIVFRYVGDILTVRELAVIFIGIIGWSKRKDIRQKFIGIIGWIKRKDIRQK